MDPAKPDAQRNARAAARRESIGTFSSRKKERGTFPPLPVPRTLPLPTSPSRARTPISRSCRAKNTWVYIAAFRAHTAKVNAVEAMAGKIGGAPLFVLAAYVLASSSYKLFHRGGAAELYIGLAIAAVAAVVVGLPALARAKRRVAAMKYRPYFLDRFGSPGHGRARCGDFFRWYTTEHHHVGLGLFTPHDVHYGLDELEHERRVEVLGDAFARYPERFPHGRPRPQALPTAVWINSPAKRANAQRLAIVMTQEGRRFAIVEPGVCCKVDQEADRLGSPNRVIRHLAAIFVS